MFVKALQKKQMQKHSDHKAVCDRKRADMITTGRVVAIICKQPTVGGRRRERCSLTHTANAPVQHTSTAMFPGFTL